MLSVEATDNNTNTLKKLHGCFTVTHKYLSCTFVHWTLAIEQKCKEYIRCPPRNAMD